MWTDKTNGLTPVRPMTRSRFNQSKLDETFELSPSQTLQEASTYERKTPTLSYPRTVSLVQNGANNFNVEETFNPEFEHQLSMNVSSSLSFSSPMQTYSDTQVSNETVLSPIATHSLPTSNVEDLDLYSQIAKRPKVLFIFHFR